MPKPRQLHPFYNFDKIMSFNAVYNFLCGARGLGKTFGAKEIAIRDAIKTGGEFIYVRRYLTELRRAKASFFADIEHKFPEWDFRVHGNEAHMSHVTARDDKKREWTLIGYFIALSSSNSYKSVSFPLVKNVLFDEFIAEKGTNYLSDEADQFNNFYSTVDRYQSRTRVFFLSNAVSINNPYFLAYDIEPDKGKEFTQYAKNRKSGRAFIVAHFPEASDFKNSVFDTEFGSFIEGTSYADYAVNNAFADNHENLIKVKNSKARYQYSLETPKLTVSVWYDIRNDEYYIQKKRAKDELLFTLLIENVDADTTFIAMNDKRLQYLRTSYNQGRVHYDHPKTRNSFIQIFRR